MSKDASLPPNAPIIDGRDSQPRIHGEEDASPASGSATVPESGSTLETVCQDLHRRVSAFLDSAPDSALTRRVQEQARISIGVIEKALKTYDFSSLSLSYNGGKDCLVLLILYLSTLYTHFRPTPEPTSPPSSRTTFPVSVPSIYAQSPDPFPAITRFVTTSSKRYHLDLCTIRTNPRPRRRQLQPNHNDASASIGFNPTPETRITIRDAFAIYLSPNPSATASSLSNQHQNQNRHSHSQIKAIFVGTRRTDPHGANLTHFDRTDHGWPDFMRIHPVIDWRLGEIWCFLRASELREPDGAPLAYCEMYDEGYTSLGGLGDTVRNPRLRYVDEDGRERYRPAYELTEDREERLGRV